MNSFKPMALSAGATLLGAAAVFTWQTLRLNELRASSAATIPRSHAAAGAQAGKTARTEPRRWEPPPPSRPEPEGVLLERFGQKMVASLTPEQFAAFHGEMINRKPWLLSQFAGDDAQKLAVFEQALARLSLERSQAYLNPKLSEAERSAAIATLMSQFESLVQEQLGLENYQAYQKAREGVVRAEAEKSASLAVSRVSQAANLSEGQKDTLYRAFLERELAKGAIDKEPSGRPLNFRIYGSVSEDPPAPDISLEAKKILTPEQAKLHQKSLELADKRNKANNDAMMGMIPKLIETVGEVLAK